MLNEERLIEIKALAQEAMSEHPGFLVPATDIMDLVETAQRLWMIVRAGQDIFKMIEEGVLVRDIQMDGDSDRPHEVMRFVQRLTKAQEVWKSIAGLTNGASQGSSGIGQSQ